MGMSRASRSKSPPCPCGGTCRCHVPSNDTWVGVGMMGVLAGVLLVWALIPGSPSKRVIHVGGRVCEVQFVATGRHCTGTGFCSDEGYEEAVCP